MSNACAPAHSLRYTDALHWAAELHRHQWRKGKPVPYIAHLIAVSGLVWEDGGTEDQAIAGLLHDAIEDAGQTKDSIALRYGSVVAGIVVACTDTVGPVEPGEEKVSNSHASAQRACANRSIFLALRRLDERG